MNSELDAKFKSWWSTVGAFIRTGPSADAQREGMYKAYCAGREERIESERQAKNAATPT